MLDALLKLANRAPGYSMLIRKYVREFHLMRLPQANQRQMNRKRLLHEVQSNRNQVGIRFVSGDSGDDFPLERVRESFVRINLHGPWRSNRQFAERKVPLITEATKPPLNDVNAVP